MLSKDNVQSTAVDFTMYSAQSKKVLELSLKIVILCDDYIKNYEDKNTYTTRYNGI